MFDPEFVARLHAAHVQRIVDGFIAARDAGMLLLLPHADSCERRTHECYIRETCWTNPYAMQVDGRERAMYVPSCRGGYFGGGRIIDAARVLCDSFGWHFGEDDYLSQPRIVREAWEGGNADIKGHWRAAVASVTPLISGGQSGDRPYFRRRDLWAAFAKLVPRLRCSCGKRMARQVRTADGVHTYLVLDAPFVKIGKTVSVRRRWGIGRVTDNPRRIKVLAVLCGNYEPAFHLRFDEFNVGGEWFKDRREIRAAFGLPDAATQMALPLVDRRVSKRGRTRG